MSPAGPGASPTADGRRRARLALTAVFGVHAGVAGSWGPQAPAIKARLGIDDGALGLALTAMALGMFGGTRLAGWALARTGPRTVIGASVPVLCAGLLAVGRAATMTALVAAMVAMGLAMGVLDVAMNAEAMDVERRWTRPVLGQMHGSWCVGLLAAGAAAAGANALGWTVATHFAAVAGVLGIAGVVATGALPAGAGARPVDRGADGSAEDGSTPAKKRYRSVAVIGLVAAASFAAEGAAIDWSAVYLHDRMGTTAAVAAFGFVAFAAGMSLGRFVADRTVGRWGAVRVVRAGGLTAAGAMALVLAAPSAGGVLVGLGLTGLALGPVVPVAFRAAGAGPDGHHRLAWVVTIAYLGTVAGPAAIGLVARFADLRSALLLVIALALTISALAGHLAGGGPLTGASAGVES